MSHVAQGYFLTHFLYVCNGWGRHPIRREMFIEEFTFLIHNLRTAVQLDDPELTGEGGICGVEERRKKECISM